MLPSFSHVPFEFRACPDVVSSTSGEWGAEPSAAVDQEPLARAGQVNLFLRNFWPWPRWWCRRNPGSRMGEKLEQTSATFLCFNRKCSRWIGDSVSMLLKTKGVRRVLLDFLWGFSPHKKQFLNCFYLASWKDQNLLNCVVFFVYVLIHLKRICT